MLIKRYTGGLNTTLFKKYEQVKFTLDSFTMVWLGIIVNS